MKGTSVEQWDDVFSRDRADLGPAVAAQRAALDVDRYGTQIPGRPLDEMLAHDYPVGFPVRLALKDLELVREVERSSKAAMPLLDVVHERFLAADEDHADEDLAAVYEVGRSGQS